MGVPSSPYLCLCLECLSLWEQELLHKFYVRSNWSRTANSLQAAADWWASCPQELNWDPFNFLIHGPQNLWADLWREICTSWLHNESLCWAGSSVGTSEGNVNKNTEGVHRYLINTHCSSTCRKCLGLAVYNQPPPKRCKCSCLGCIRFSEVYMLEMSPVWSCHS